MQHSVSLLFDVEDLCWAGSDDITLDLARLLSQENLEGTFLVVGKKVELWRERQRDDIIEALSQHEVGSHTSKHSLHPTVAEYLAPLTWQDGVYAVQDDEQFAIDIIRETFGVAPETWGQAGGSWGPQLHQGLAKLGIQSMVYPHTRIGPVADVHYYADMRVFPDGAICFFDADLCDDTAFETALTRMEDTLIERTRLGTRWTGIFVCHPTRLRAIEFWDALNFAKGQHSDPENYRLPSLRSEAEYQTALKNFSHLLKVLQNNPRLDIQSIRQAAPQFSPPDSNVYLDEIDNAVEEYQHQEIIPTNIYRFSPAELLDIMMRIYCQAEDYENEFRQRREVLGPIEEPGYHDPDHDTTYWEDFLGGCRLALNYINREGCLPPSVYVGQDQWHIGAIFHAALSAWQAFRTGVPPKTLTWRPAPLFPNVGQEIAAQVQTAYAGWPIHQPDVDLNNLLMHTSFQSWTLRPAYRK